MAYTIDYSGKTVLITGGTKGIGLATGLEFGAAGATAFLTHKWGSADEDAIRQQFADAGAPEPVILQADAAEKADVKATIAAVADKGFDKLDVFISNVGFALLTPDFDDYKLKSFQRTLEYCSWPLITHLKQAKKQFGAYPGYAIAVSSDGPSNIYPAYDFVANSKASLETFAMYLAKRLAPEGCRVNTVRAGIVLTESYRATFGDDFVRFLENHAADYVTTCEEVADGILAVCSGLLDGMLGHTLVIDKGAHVRDNLINMLSEKLLVPNPEFFKPNTSS